MARRASANQVPRATRSPHEPKDPRVLVRVASPIPRYAACLAVALLLASGAYGATAMVLSAKVSDAWEHMWDVTEQRQVYEFYRADIERAAAAPDVKRVYFLGSSTTRFDINATMVDDVLHSRGHESVVTYNLGVSGDWAVRRLPEIPLIIEAHPDVVVLGFSHLTIQKERKDGWLASRMAELVDTAPPVEPGTPLARALGPYASLYGPKDPGSAFFAATKTTIRDNRDRFQGAVDAVLGSRSTPDGKLEIVPPVLVTPNHEQAYTDQFGNSWRALSALKGNFKDPWGGDAPDLTSAAKARWARVEHLNDEGVLSLNVAALRYTVRALNDAGIHVVLAYMPNAPFYQATLAPGEEDAYAAPLRQIAQEEKVPLHDLRDDFPDRMFMDAVHMNGRGRVAFADAAADVVEKELYG